MDWFDIKYFYSEQMEKVYKVFRFVWNKVVSVSYYFFITFIFFGCLIAWIQFTLMLIDANLLSEEVSVVFGAYITISSVSAMVLLIDRVFGIGKSK